MRFLKRFFAGLQRDFRIFVFILLLLEIYRALFTFMMSGYIGEGTDSSQIWLAQLAGIRLSLKTAGVVTLLSFVLVHSVMRGPFEYSSAPKKSGQSGQMSGNQRRKTKNMRR